MNFTLKAPGIRIGNASDEDISVIFDSQEKIFPANGELELEAHFDFPRTKGGAIIRQNSTAVDAFGRRIDSFGAPIPKEGSSSVDIAQFCLKEKGPLGLYHITGDEKLDSVARKAARATGVKTRVTAAEKIMAEWRQTCRLASNQGTPIPPMPEHVAKADRFLLKNAEEARAASAVKRFQVKIDGASYDTLAEAKKHIFDRPAYVELRDTWRNHVADRFGDDNLVVEKAEKPVDTEVSQVSEEAEVKPSKKK